ncbi:MAG: GrpB family protein [Oligoflexia bacterium]|nr:GrpB family protein [Oligoflexia bacterium]
MNRIEEFTKNKIGMKRDGNVYLVDHQKNWCALAQKEIHYLIEKLSISDLTFFHIGSSSVPGIKAKPIIDLVGSCQNIHEVDDKQKIFESLGYEYKGEYGIAGRRYCVLYNASKEISYIHLHIFSKNSNALNEHLLFASYLKENLEMAKIYENKKIALMTKPRHEYTEGKSELIKEILQQAREWQSSLS